MRSFKIVVTGPFSAGKTTFIKSISEIAIVSTERAISDSTRRVKAETTVAMDFGRITISKDIVLYLFGTPGQERFDFMWQILSEGMLGYILMLDASSPDTYTEGKRILEFFATLSDAPYVVAATRIEDGDPAKAVEGIRNELSVDGEVQIIPCQAMEKEDVKKVLLGLLYDILKTLDK
ncbi:MAG: GTP-binding protein [Actinobacteria bacterium RBG_19FT_COMBO_54_7]|uniref:GTP-binding protein n=1 Tax=Candidatus Solincola sediminis TaxID=1797199 RepID=A0A1F2WFM0_9ACTN|nr:MAG: GTP-binding protein [Candidatus Solincola sediminis]OFW58079.1 MAG: GTP-binding protein [Candidatus Solincola sediminis]OFW65831.1 MAG: GTP-binding protein [Actinobacteria bacterium RBG_19FT_COMBO_54_7]